MQRHKKLRPLLSIVLIVMLLFSTALPVMASSTTEVATKSDVAQNANTLTVPLKFDGSEPDRSEVVVKNAPTTSPQHMMRSLSAASTVEPDDGLPKKVETVMEAVYDNIPDSITLITADQYFLYIPYGETSPKMQFIAQLDGFLDNENYGYPRYFAKISTSDTDASKPHIDSYLLPYNNKLYIDVGDMSDIVSDAGTHSIYISIWESEDSSQTGVSKRLYGPVQIQVNYVEDAASVRSYNRYIHKDAMNFYIYLQIPGTDNKLNNGPNPGVTLALINSSGQVVAKNIEERDDYVDYWRSIYTSNDDRYESIFGYSYYIERDCGQISTYLHRAAEFIPGIYGLRVTYNDGTYVDYENLLQVVEGIFIEGLGYSSQFGFPPPVVGGSEAYVTLYAQNANKDDFEVSILDGDGNVISSSEASRYMGDYSTLIIYKVKLKDGKIFEKDKKYSIQLTCNSGKIYYSGDNQNSGLYPESNFRIYDYSFNQGKSLADFTLKAVNVPSDPAPITLELSSTYNYPYGILSTVQVRPGASMQVQFKDDQGNILSLSPGSYEIRQISNSSWSNYLSFYVDRDYYPDQDTVYKMGKPYFYITDTSYDFEVTLSKEKYHLTESSTYRVTLKNSVGEAVYAAVYGDDINVEDTTINNWDEYGAETNTPAVKLSGKLALLGSLKEGVYYLYVDINNGPANNLSAIINVSGLASDKIYALISYPEIIAGPTPGIDGYAYMLKKDEGYDASKFEYELTDLLGNSITVGSLKVTRYSDASNTYQDYYKIDASIAGTLPAAYYFLKLKYDGKEIYALYNPVKPVFEGYHFLKEAPVKPQYYGHSYADGIIINAIYIKGYVGQDSEISALLYDPKDKENFEPIKTVPLQKDPEVLFKYVLTQTEVDSTKSYDAVFLCDGIPIGYLKDQRFETQSIQSTPVTGISVDPSTLDIKVGEAKQLAATLSPSNATNKKVTWTSDRETVATVDASGRVTGISAGTATITATTQDGSFTAQCTVTVTANIASLTVSKLEYFDHTEIIATDGIYNIDGAKFSEDASKPLNITFAGTNFNAEKTYNYTISFNNQNAIASGNATGAEIIAGITKSFERSSEQTDGSYTYNIIVKDGTDQVAFVEFTVNISGVTVPVTGVSVNRRTLSLGAGATSTLSAVVTPSNATNKNIKWSSDKNAVATVDENTGLVTAVGAGSATITATTEDGAKTASCTVNVGVNVSGKLNCGEEAAQHTWISLYKGTTYISWTYTDANGNFSFANISAGDYTLQAYSPSTRYKALNQNFTIDEGETSKELSPIRFESKYANMSNLTVNVTNASDSALGSSFNVYVYNYETGVSTWIPSDGSSKSISVSDLPYETGGSLYYVYLSTGEETDYYHSSTTVNINNSTVTVDLNVPVTYKISGTIKDSDGFPVQYTGITATKDGNTYWGYSDDKGVYTIRGLANGTYSLEINNSKYTADPVSATITDASVTSGADIIVQQGLTLTGKVLKGSVPAYKAYVQLTDNSNSWVAGGYATGEGGFVLEGAIKKAGTYKLAITSVYNQNGTWKSFVSTPVIFDVTAENISAGRLSKDISYQDPTNASAIFTGSGNLVLTDVGVVHSGSSVNLIIKYKNNGNSTITANFTAMLPEGVTGSNTFEVTNLSAKASGQKSIALTIGNPSTNYLTIPVKASIGGIEYDFGTASIEVANITLNGPGAVKTTEGFKVYGDATANSEIVIKNLVTGEVLGSAKPNGRWYSAELKPLPEGTYNLVAEATSAGVTTASQILVVESRADQITVDSVAANSQDSTDLPVNKLIGVRAFTAWVGSDLNGRDINLGVKFGNDSSIADVTYHFADKDFEASKDLSGRWNANLTGWSGAGLKTITATARTSDGRTLTFIIAEVTVLIDPSGYVKDNETGKRLAGVAVVCEVLNGDSWEIWDAARYGQINPQITDDDGNYGWMVPEGTYRVRALKNGYTPYVTTEDPAFSDDAGNSTIIIPPVRADVNFVLSPSVQIETIALNETSTSIAVGSTETLSAIVTPDDATNASSVEWTSSNTNVATVVNGVVRAVNKGTAIITAAIGSKTATCEVTVTGDGSTDENDNTDESDNTVEDDSTSENNSYNPGPSTSTGNTPTVVDAKPSVTADASGKATLKYEQLEKAEQLTVKAAVTLTFDKAAIASIKSSAGDTTVAVTKADTSMLSAEAKNTIGDRPVFEFTVIAGGKAVSDFGGGIVKVDVPYTPKSDEDPNAIVLYYIDESGKLNLLIDSVYDPEAKCITFRTTHFSKYAVGYNKVEFSDVSGWAADYITYLSARGIINGVGNNKYEPLNNITRADFAVVLAKCAGADLNIYTASRFSDIDTNDYFAKSVEWAADKGIVNGVGNNKYAPEAYITRQDMARMVVNFAKAMDYELPIAKPAADFADQADISAYAVDAAKAVQQAGIIGGKTYGDRLGSFFAPKDNATRAEAAKMLTILLQGMMK